MVLKEFARGAVEGLVRNKLMVDAEAEGVSYLTCVEVGVGDFRGRGDRMDGCARGWGGLSEGRGAGLLFFFFLHGVMMRGM